MSDWTETQQADIATPPSCPTVDVIVVRLHKFFAVPQGTSVQVGDRTTAAAGGTGMLKQRCQASTRAF